MFITIFAFLMVMTSITSISMIRLTVAENHAGPYFKVEPATVTMGPSPCINQTFTVAVKLYNVTTDNAPNGIAGLEIIFKWNTTLIEPLSFVNKIGALDGVLVSPVLYGKDAGFYDETEQKITNPPYTNATSYRVAAATTVADWWGNGTVMEITFNVTYQPHEPEQSASCTLLIAFTDLYDVSINPVAHEKEDGYYEVLSIPLLPLPSLAISPAAFNASYVGQTFIANVTIQGLVDSWNMSGHTFNLTFNPTYLQVLSVSEGDFLKSFGSTIFEKAINNTAGFVWVNETQLEDGRSAPFGNGTLASVTFNATARPPAKCELTISEVSLQKWQATEPIPPLSVSKGYYEMFEILSHTILWNNQSFTVSTRSNSLVENMVFNAENKTLSFNITGITGTNGYSEVTIPKSMLKAPENATAWQVIVGTTSANYIILAENTTHTTLAFSYNHSTKTVKIVGTWAVGKAEAVPSIDWMTIAIIVIVVVAVLLIVILVMRYRKKSQHSTKI
jgi:hypothetical protein